MGTLFKGPGATLVKTAECLRTLTGGNNAISCVFWEMSRDEDGGPRWSATTQDGRAYRSIGFNWPDHVRSYGAAAFLGYSGVVKDAASGKRWISRSLPENLAAFGLPWLWCQDMPSSGGVRKEGRSGDFATYGGVKCDFTYAALRYNLLGDTDTALLAASSTGPLAGFPDEGLALQNGGVRATRYVSVIRRPAYRQLTIPQGIMTDSDGKIIGEGLPLIQPRMEMTYIHHDVPEIPWQAIGVCSFGVNGVVFDGFSVESLLYLGPDVVERTSPFGVQVTDLHHKFLWLPNYSLVARDGGGKPIPRGHNWILRYSQGPPAILDYKKAQVVNGTQPPFLQQDFATLFRPNP